MQVTWSLNAKSKEDLASVVEELLAYPIPPIPQGECIGVGFQYINSKNELWAPDAELLLENTAECALKTLRDIVIPMMKVNLLITPIKNQTEVARYAETLVFPMNVGLFIGVRNWKGQSPWPEIQRDQLAREREWAAKQKASAEA